MLVACPPSARVPRSFSPCCGRAVVGLDPIRSSWSRSSWSSAGEDASAEAAAYEAAIDAQEQAAAAQDTLATAGPGRRRACRSTRLRPPPPTPEPTATPAAEVVE